MGIPRRAYVPAASERSHAQTIRDIILTMTWQELEAFAENLNEWATDSDGYRCPIDGELLNRWARDVELEGDKP